MQGIETVADEHQIIQPLRAELHREHLVRLVSQAVEKLRVDRGRFFPDQSGERGAFRAVSLAPRAEASSLGFSVEPGLSSNFSFLYLTWCKLFPFIKIHPLRPV
jgi:hypothetical protein